MALVTVSKQPGDKIPLAIDYYGNLPPGGQLASASVAAVINGTATSATSTVIQNIPARISGTQVWFGVQAGTSGVTYKVTVTTTLVDGSILEDDFLLAVQEA